MEGIGNHIGILHIVISGLSYGSLGIFVQLITFVHILESSSVRGLFLVLLPLIELCISRFKPRCSKSECFWIMANACASTAVQTTLFIAYGLAPAGDVNAIVYSSPLLSGVLARIFLKETLAYYDVILSLVSLVGVFFISKPTFIFGTTTPSETEDHFVGTMWAIGGLLCYSIPPVTSRKLRRKSTTATVITLTFGLVAFSTNATLNSFIGAWSIPGSANEIAYLIAVGLSGFFGIHFFNLSLKTEKAVFSTLSVTILTILSTYILQVVVFQVYPDVFTGIGIVLIFGATIGAFIAKWRESQETTTERSEDVHTKEKDATTQTDFSFSNPALNGTHVEVSDTVDSSF